MANTDFLDYLRGRGQNFNAYAAGNKRYGAGGRDAPNYGMSDKLGYRERDAEAALRLAAMRRRLAAMQKGNFMSSAYLTPERQQ